MWILSIMSVFRPEILMGVRADGRGNLTSLEMQHYCDNIWTWACTQGHSWPGTSDPVRLRTVRQQPTPFSPHTFLVLPLEKWERSKVMVPRPSAVDDGLCRGGREDFYSILFLGDCVAFASLVVCTCNVTAVRGFDFRSEYTMTKNLLQWKHLLVFAWVCRGQARAGTFGPSVPSL